MQGTVAIGVLAAGVVLTAGGSRGATFGEDVAFLREHVDVIVLSGKSAQDVVAVVPQYQGRVMTSSTGGKDGPSFGYVNRGVIASDASDPHMNMFGGEDRFWVGPEGGQFAVYFPRGASFAFDNWKVPPGIDTQPFAVTARGRTHASFQSDLVFTNWIGKVLSVRVNRTIRLLEESPVGPLPDRVRRVSFESVNRMTNTGAEPWKKETGLLSIWILGMFQPSDATTVVLPYRAGPDDLLGPVVNDLYFGKVPADRLAVDDRAVYYKADGKQRGKIGTSPGRAADVLGSYDPNGPLLTIVTYNKPGGVTGYVNSMWALQTEPYGGDVVMSYNDGGTGEGAGHTGTFYELESSSPAALLSVNESITHIHTTTHLTGPPEDLDPVARRLLGVGLEAIEGALD